MKSKLKYYGLEGSSLEIKQGFEIINDIKTNKEFTQIATAMVGMEADLKMLHQRLDSLAAKDTLQKMVSACVRGTRKHNNTVLN